MTPPSAVAADALLADRYRLLERIAVGGMGEVWRAQDTLLDRLVAVKVLKPEFVGDEDFRARFRAEARHAGRLTHSGIASVHDFGESPASAWLVMELVDGEALSALLRREGALSVDRTLDLVTQAADALHAAHLGGVVHRDVKPGNLLVRPDGVLKVTDFGIASATDAVPLTQTGLVVGTAYYLSPEQAAGRSGSPASDVYSLGVVAYECLTGARPFPGDSPVAVAVAHLREPPPPLPSTIPAPVRALVERAMAKDPGDRFADAAEMADWADRLRNAATADGGGLAALPVAPPAAARPDGAQEPLPDSALAPTGLLQVPTARRLPGSGARSSRRMVTTAAALLAVLAVGLGARAALEQPEPEPLPAAAPASVTVPQIEVGTPAERASAAVTAAGLTPSQRRGPSQTVPVGGVVSVDPAPGTSVEPGAPVVLVVSTGPATVRVDAAAYLGRPAAEVRSALAGLGLVPRLAYDGRGRPVGTVSAVEPAGDLAVGSVVLVRVVPAPPPAPVAVPPPPSPSAPAVVAPAPVDRPGKGKGKGRK